MHLFDEPQFNTQDGYIGFMLDFFRTLRAEDRLVFLCLHPNEPYHLEILRESCERFLFVNQGPADAGGVVRGAGRRSERAQLSRCAGPTPPDADNLRARYSGNSVK